MVIEDGDRAHPPGAPQRCSTEQGQAPEALGEDPVLAALADLVNAAGQMAEATTLITTRAAHIRTWRQQGRSYRDIIDADKGPLIAERLTETIARFEAAGTRFRQAEARALWKEGMTMAEIGARFRLTRQRISALVHTAPPARTDTARAAPPAPPGEHQARRN